MEKNNGLTLESAAPLDDGLRKYNILYFIFACIGFLIGIVDAGFRQAIAWTIFGLVIGFLIKAVIADTMMRRLYLLVFNLPDANINNAQLMKTIVKPLTSLGMTVEMNSDGSPCITHGKIKYNVKIHGSQNNTFSLYWNLSFARTFFLYTYIPYYRQAVVSMGLIAYTIQDEVSKINKDQNNKGE